MTADVMITGHRALPESNWTWVGTEMRRVLQKLTVDPGIATCLHGAALGADQLYATIALELGLPVVSYVPFAAQAASWAPDDQDRHRDILNRSDRVVLVTPGDLGERREIVRALHARNDAMIRDSDTTIAVLDSRTTGGTHSTAAKALRAGNTLIRINPTRRTTSLIKELR